MTPAQRQDWILQYLLNKQAALGANCPYSVDILCERFVDDYTDATGAACRPQIIGANKSAALGRDLSKLHAAGLLNRSRAGITAPTSGGGWPKWVYGYRLASPDIAARRFGLTFDEIRSHIIATNRAYDFATINHALAA